MQVLQGKGRFLKLVSNTNYLQLYEIEILADEYPSVFHKIFKGREQKITVSFTPTSFSSMNPQKTKVYSYEIDTQGESTQVSSIENFDKFYDNGFVPLIQKYTNEKIGWDFADTFVNEEQLKLHIESMHTWVF